MTASPRHTSCPACGSSDARAVYPDGHSHCFSCGDHKAISNNFNSLTPIPGDFKRIPERKISEATTKRYGVTVLGPEHRIYPYPDASGTHVANKMRLPDKNFHWEGDSKKAGLFGMDVFPAGSSKSITVTEGEDDAMAYFEMTGYPAVSVKSAVQAASDARSCFEYLNSFETIVLCFDKDEAKIDPTTGLRRYPGQEAAVTVAGMFPLGKVRIVTWGRHKDACDYLVAGDRDVMVKEWWAGPVFTPQGIKMGSDLWEAIVAPKQYETVTYPWEGLQYKTYGLRLSEAVLVTADTGIGKTTILKELESHILKNTDKDTGVGFMHLEEPNDDTALGLMSIEANLPLHLPDVRERVTDEDLRKYFDASVNNDRVVLWDHFGSNSIEEVLNKIRHMKALGCKYIVLDHVSIVVSDQSGDERKQLDEIMTKMKTLCMELNICIVIVAHINRQGTVRGTAALEQLSNIVIRLVRDKTDPSPWRQNITKVIVEKNRFCGRTGVACYLLYHEKTGRLTELDPTEISLYESGGSAETEEEWENV